MSPRSSPRMNDSHSDTAGVLQFSTLNALITVSVQRHEGYKSRNAATSPSEVCGVMPKHRAGSYSRGGKNYSNCSSPGV
jgi:hypothetical protein